MRAEATLFDPIPAVDRERWAQHAEAIRHRLARMLRGVLVGDRPTAGVPGPRVSPALETPRARVTFDHGTRASLLRVTVARHDRAPHEAVAVELPLDRLDPYVLAAVVRAASRTPWRSRLRRALYRR